MRYLKSFLLFLLIFFSLKSVSFAIVYQDIWLFNMQDGIGCDPILLQSEMQTCFEDNTCIPAGCTPSDWVCNSSLAGTFLVTCGTIPGNFQGAVAGSAVLVDQSLNGITAVKDAAFESWYNATGTPVCPDGSGPGGVSAGYLESESTGSVPGTANVTLAFYKRVHCSANGVTSTGLKPIDELFVGGAGGGGSTDMTATNTAIGETNTLITAGNTESAAQTTLLTGIKGAIEAQGPNSAGGGGTVNVDVTGVETRLDATNTGITDVGLKLDGISTKLDGVYVGGVGSGSADDKTVKESSFLSSSLTDFGSFQTSVKSTPFYNSIGTFFNGVPSGGTSVFSVSAGSLGQHSIDLSTYGNVWNIIKALVLIACSYVSIKIIFLGRA